MITRRLFLRWLLGLPFLSLLSFPVPESQAEPLNPTAKLIHVDIDPNELGKIFLPAVGMVADVGEALRALLEALHSVKIPEADLKSREERCRTLRETFLRETAIPEFRLEGTPVSSLAITLCLAEVLAPTDIIVLHSVTFEKWFMGFYDQRVNPAAFHFGAGGTLGWGYPAALGVQVARPEQRVVNIMGDGGFIMNLQELETAVREKIPVKVIVNNNFCYGNIRSRQVAEFGGRLIGSLYTNPDFGQIANCFGAYGEKVEREADLLAALKDHVVAEDGRYPHVRERRRHRDAEHAERQRQDAQR